MLIFDIETEANQDAIQFMPEPSAPANYKDEAKIEAYIESKRADMVETAALDADYGKIAAIGVKPEGDWIESRVVGKNVDSEKELIEWFWGLYSAAGGCSCGYNVVGFDLPYLMRRSFGLGIKPKTIPVLAKYRTEPTLDLMGVLYNWGQAKSLKWVCERYGIKNELPDLDGSQVKDMDLNALIRYVENDVLLTWSLYEKMKGVYF